MSGRALAAYERVIQTACFEEPLALSVLGLRSDDNGLGIASPADRGMDHLTWKMIAWREREARKVAEARERSDVDDGLIDGEACR